MRRGRVRVGANLRGTDPWRHLLQEYADAEWSMSDAWRWIDWTEDGGRARAVAYRRHGPRWSVPRDDGIPRPGSRAAIRCAPHDRAGVGGVPPCHVGRFHRGFHLLRMSARELLVFFDCLNYVAPARVRARREFGDPQPTCPGATGVRLKTCRCLSMDVHSGSRMDGRTAFWLVFDRTGIRRQDDT